MKSLSSISSNYQTLVQKILENMQKTQREILRQKVEMSWEIGRLVEENLLQNSDETYGKNLILSLERDTKLPKSSLYKMRSFYKNYPELPQDDRRLNWSHYRILAGIENKNQRNHLEKLIKTDGLSSTALQQKVSKIKANKIIILKAPEALKVTRGKLFTYKTIKLADSNEILTDLGFNIFSKLAVGFSAGTILQSKRDESGKYSFTKSPNNKKLHTYKAALERVVDGDTVRVVIDLGFNVKHREIIRLAKINAPERDTKEGKKATAALESILKNVKTLILKTNKTDIYGRYIADIFLENEEGEYLSQILLDKGLVSVF